MTDISYSIVVISFNNSSYYLGVKFLHLLKNYTFLNLYQDMQLCDQLIKSFLIIFHNPL